MPEADDNTKNAPNPAAAEADAAGEASKGGLPAETPGADPINAQVDLASRARTEDLTGAAEEEMQPEGDAPVTRAEFDDLMKRVDKIERTYRHFL